VIWFGSFTRYKGGLVSEFQEFCFTRQKLHRDGVRLGGPAHGRATARYHRHPACRACSRPREYRLEAYATLGRISHLRSGRQQRSIGILPVGPAAAAREYRLQANATLGRISYGRSGRQQRSIGILPVGPVAGPPGYRLEAYATLGRVSYMRSGRQQRSICILPVGRVAAGHVRRSSAFTELAVLRMRSRLRKAHGFPRRFLTDLTPCGRPLRATARYTAFATDG